MESFILEKLKRKERECRSYQRQADEFRRQNDYRPSEEQCLVLQKAADLEYEMAQLTTGAERAHHEREKNRLDYEIRDIREALNISVRETPKAKTAADGSKDDAAKASEKGQNTGKTRDEENLDRTARTWYKEAPRHSFDDVSGMSDLKKRLQECAADAKAEKLMEFLKIPQLNSYFFVGPPGCGKTYIIEAFAHELMNKDYKFMSLQGSDIISRYVGDAEKIVTRLFEEAEKNAPCIIFIDEIDSVCKNRSLPNLPEYAANITTSFLTGYNRIHSVDSKIIFIGATNYPERVDSAMLDRVEVIRVPLPDHEARRAAFQKQFEDIIALEDGLTEDYMAQRTENYNYRDIDRITNAIKRSIFKDIMALVGNQFSAMELLHNGEYKLTKRRFDDALGKFEPSPKKDILDAIDRWERLYQQTQE